MLSCTLTFHFYLFTQCNLQSSTPLHAGNFFISQIPKGFIFPTYAFYIGCNIIRSYNVNDTTFFCFISWLLFFIVLFLKWRLSVPCFKTPFYSCLPCVIPISLNHVIILFSLSWFSQSISSSGSGRGKFCFAFYGIIINHFVLKRGL